MLAKLVQANIDPRRVDDAARAVTDELIPLFVAHPGARQGYWMANRTTGQVLVMTCWSDLDSLEASRAADGKERTGVAERLGLRIHAIHTVDVLGFHENAVVDKAVLRWARATWVDALSLDLDASLRAMHQEVVPAEARSHGFCASYWLANYETGSGLGLSLWSDLAGLRDNEPDSKRRRKWFEQTVGRKIDLVGEYEAIGVVAPATIDLTETTSAAQEIVNPTDLAVEPSR
jgi:hypothetical protein